MESIHSLDLRKTDVIEALLEGGMKLRRLRQVVRAWQKIEDARPPKEEKEAEPNKP